MGERELWEKCKLDAKRIIESLGVSSEKVEDALDRRGVKTGVFSGPTFFAGAYYRCGGKDDFCVGINRAVLRDPKCGTVLAHELLHAAGLPDHHWFAALQCKVFGRCYYDSQLVYRDVPRGECCFMKDPSCKKLDSLCERDLKTKSFMKR